MWSTGINRNIVECKVAAIVSGNLGTSINRNIVECKVAKAKRYTAEQLVLIETLWNVKGENQIEIDCSATGINRNIVECKVASPQAFVKSDAVLIETLWNVKLCNTA